ncbi:unnamed protein product [Brassica oleracea]
MVDWKFPSIYMNRIRPSLASKPKTFFCASKPKTNKQKREKEEKRRLKEMGTKADHTCVDAKSTSYYVLTQIQKAH